MRTMRSMRFVNFLFFLVIISDDCAGSGVEDNRPLAIAMDFDAPKIGCSRVYQYCDEQGQEHRINVAYNVRNSSVRGFVLRDEKMQQELLIAMRVGDDKRDVLHTALYYKARAREDIAIVSSWAEKNEGWIKITAPAWTYRGEPGCKPVLWSAPIAPTREHAYGTINTDKKGASVTRYVFSSDDGAGVFVRMRVQYKNLCDVRFSWGKEAYGGAAHDDADDNIIVHFRSG